MSALVTGGSTGIGAAVAQALHDAGLPVARLARRPGEGPGLALASDLRDPAAVAAAVARCERELGPVDLLVNGAGRIESVERPFWEVDPAEAWDVVETNLRGPMLTCAAVLPGMVARGSGRVVNVTSRARAAAKTGHYTAYAVSKTALSRLTETLAVATRGTGVTVFDLLPGLVRSPMTDAMPVWREVPEEDWDPAEASAALVLRIAAGELDARSGELLDATAPPP